MKLRTRQPVETEEIVDDYDDEPVDDTTEQNGFDEEFDDLDEYGDDFDGIGGMPPMEKHADLLKDLTNFAPYLKDTVNGWLGLSWDENAGKYVPSEYIKPIMNRHCAAWCVSLLKTYARGNNIITDVHSQAYKDMLGDIIENIWLNVGTRADLDFGIKSDGDILRICNELEHASALVLMGAGDGRYNKFLSGTISANYSGQMGGSNPLGSQPVINNINQRPDKMGALRKVKEVFLGT